MIEVFEDVGAPRGDHAPRPASCTSSCPPPAPPEASPAVPRAPPPGRRGRHRPRAAARRRSPSSARRAGAGRSAASCCTTSSTAGSAATCTSCTRSRGELGPITTVPPPRRPPARRRPRRRSPSRPPTWCGVARAAAARRACGRSWSSAPGSREAGAARARAARRPLRGVCRGAGMRLVGPNCLGVVSTRPGRPRSTRPSRPQRVPAGTHRAGLPERRRRDHRHGPRGAPRARAVGVRLPRQPRRRLQQRPAALLGRATRGRGVIALYLESFGNPRRVRRGRPRGLATLKPVVARQGRPFGRRAAAPPRRTPARWSRAREALADALFDDAGVCASTRSASCWTSRASSPRASRRAGGGVGDPDQRRRRRHRLRRRLRGRRPERPGPLPADPARVLHRDRPQAATGNPVDLVADATAEDFTTALTTLADDRRGRRGDRPARPAAGRPRRRSARRGRRTRRAALPVPVLAVPLAQDRPAGLAGRLPLLDTPEEAAARPRPRRAPPGSGARGPPTRRAARPGIDRAAAAASVAEALARGGGWLAPDLTWRAGRAPTACPSRPRRSWPSVRGVADAAAARRRPGRGQGGGRRPGAQDRAWRRAPRPARVPRPPRARRPRCAMQLRAARADVRGFLVQPMVPGGVELLRRRPGAPGVRAGRGLRRRRDAGGALADVQVRLAPVGARRGRRRCSARCAASRCWRAGGGAARRTSPRSRTCIARVGRAGRRPPRDPRARVQPAGGHARRRASPSTSGCGSQSRAPTPTPTPPDRRPQSPRRRRLSAAWR